MRSSSRSEVLRHPSSIVRAVMVFVLVTVMGLPLAAGAAHAAPSAAPAEHLAAAPSRGDGLDVAVKSTSPATLGTDTDLHVTATVRNTSDANLSGGKATLRLGTNALDSLTAQQDWADSTTGLRSGPSATTTVPDLAPGGSAEVQITLPSSDIHVSFDMTTLPVEVDVTGTVGGGQRHSSVHSFTAWNSSTGSFTKMSTQVVVPVSLPSDPALFTATGSDRFRAWNKAIGPGSAIDKLLSANPSVPVTWLIDPTVLDPPTAQDPSLPSTATLASDGTVNPASGSSTAASSPTSAPTSAGATASGGTSSGGTASQLNTVDELAQRLRDKLAKRPKSQQIWFTPYGDPDLSALTSAHRPRHAETLLKRMLGRTLPPSLTTLSSTMVAAPVAPLTTGATERLRSAWHDARGTDPVVVTPGATLDGTSSATVVSTSRTTAAGLRMVGFNSALSETLASTDLSDGEAAATVSARSLAIYQQQPSADRSMLLMGSRHTISASRLGAIANTLKALPWTSPAAASLNASTSGSARARLHDIAPSSAGVWPVPGSSAIDTGVVSTMEANLSGLTRTAGIVDDGSDIVPAWGRSLDQAASTRWRSEPSTVSSLVGASRSTVDSIPGRVHVLPAGTINFFTDSGRLTVTVRNDLARTVKNVRLHVTPHSYAIRFTQPGPVTIDAGSRAGLRIPTTAQAAGSITVAARLRAQNGVALGGTETRPTMFTINARPTGTWIYWALGIVALLVFCYGVARNRKKGTRRRDELARDIQL